MLSRRGGGLWAGPLCFLAAAPSRCRLRAPSALSSFPPSLSQQHPEPCRDGPAPLVQVTWPGHVLGQHSLQWSQEKSAARSAEKPRRQQLLVPGGTHWLRGCGTAAQGCSALVALRCFRPSSPSSLSCPERFDCFCCFLNGLNRRGL